MLRTSQSFGVYHVDVAIFVYTVSGADSILVSAEKAVTQGQVQDFLMDILEDFQHVTNGRLGGGWCLTGGSYVEEVLAADVFVIFISFITDQPKLYIPLKM